MYHLLRCGEAKAAVDNALDLIPTLLDWGYVDLAEQELTDLEKKASDVLSGDLRRKGMHALFLGRVHDARGSLSVALTFLEQSERASEAAGDFQTLAHTFHRIGRILNARSDFTRAEDYFMRCLTLCHAHDLPVPRAAVTLSIAWSKKNRGAEDKDVLEALQESLEIAKETRDWKTWVAAHRQIGFLLWDKFRQKVEAEDHYREAVHLAEEKRFARELGAAAAELGYLYDEWGQTGEAEAYCLRALDISYETGDLYLRANARCNLAKVFESRKDWEQARLAYEKSIDELRGASNESGEAFARLKLGVVWNKLGNKCAARENIERARSLCEKNDLQDVLKTVQKSVGEMLKYKLLVEVGHCEAIDENRTVHQIVIRQELLPVVQSTRWDLLPGHLHFCTAGGSACRVVADDTFEIGPDLYARMVGAVQAVDKAVAGGEDWSARRILLHDRGALGEALHIEIGRHEFRSIEGSPQTIVVRRAMRGYNKWTKGYLQGPLEFRSLDGYLCRLVGNETIDTFDADEVRSACDRAFELTPTVEMDFPRFHIDIDRFQAVTENGTEYTVVLREEVYCERMVSPFRVWLDPRGYFIALHFCTDDGLECAIRDADSLRYFPAVTL